MKGKKNLEKAIVMGLLLSASVYGTAWGAPEISEDGNTITFNPKFIEDVYDEDGKFSYHKYEDQLISEENHVLYDGKEINEFENIIINFTPQHDGFRANDPYSFRLTAPATNVTITVNESSTENNDGIHLTNWNPHFVVNTYTAYINANKSDAINLSHDGTTAYATMNNVKAVIKDGNGIRANAKVGENESNTITINQSTDITINANSSSRVARPTAVWAGDSQRYANLIITTIGAETKGKGSVYLNGNTKLTLNGTGNYGIFAGKNGNIEANNLNILSKGTKSYGVAATNDNIIYGTSLDKSQNRHGSTVTLKGDINTIIMGTQNNDGTVTKAEGSKALYAEGVDANNNSNSVKSGDNGIGMIDFVGDIVAENGGAISLNVTGDYQNFLQGDIIAFGAVANKNANIDLTAKSALAYEGDALAANGGVVNVVIGDYSNWSGRADNYQDADNREWLEANKVNLDTKFSDTLTSGGKVTIDMGNSSIWNVKGQSWIDKLTSNNGFIIMDGEGTGGYALHVGEIVGSNTFVMNVRPDASGDMLYIKNGSSTPQNLIINNPDEVLENMNVGDIVRFATISNPGRGFENGEFGDETDIPDLGNNVQTFGKSTRINDKGMFNVDFDILYTNYGEKLENDLGTEEDYNGGTNFTQNKPGVDNVNANYKTEDTLNANIVRKNVTKENLSDAGKTIINMSRANYKNAIYMDRLNKRLGEAHYINGEDEQGMWVRLRHDRIGQSGAFRSMNTMYELGYDVKQDCDNGERRVGMAVDYMRGSTSYSDIAGKGETKRYGLWLYDTWLGDKGHYVDYVAKWGHLDNDFDIYTMTGGEKVNGDYSNNVFSVSAEYGKKNDMGNNWYFEPQAQLQLARVTGADYVSSQNTKVSVDGINSLIGRAGFRLGRDLNENSTVYVKADLLHEFLGDQTITATDATGTFRDTFENKGTWYDVGFGFATALSNSSYAFMDFEKSFGNDNDETYQINAGVQWTF